MLIQRWSHCWNNVEFGLTLKMILFITNNASEIIKITHEREKDNLISTLKHRR